LRLLYLGDLVGRSGRNAVIEALPDLRNRYQLDFVIVNCENAAGGFGVTEQICLDLFHAGADVLTSGNHIWDQKEIVHYIDDEPRLLRPINYPKDSPGKGIGHYTASNGETIMVINAQGQLYMPPLDDPFHMVEEVLDQNPIPDAADVLVIDFHAEATSEKMAMGHFADGRASLVVGSHTHVPTADAHILPGGTAYQTDAGMCGNYDSVIGMEKSVPVERFRSKFSPGRLSPADGPATICGIIVETGRDGLAKHIAPLQLGGCLPELSPET